MEVNPDSKKRNLPFSSLIHTAVGYFTRNSGSNGVQHDSSRRSNPEPKLKRPRSAISDEGNVILNDLVKDLRSRRVFSPSSVLSEYGCVDSNDDAKSSKNEDLKNVDEKKFDELKEDSNVEVVRTTPPEPVDSGVEEEYKSLEKPLNGNSQNIHSKTKVTLKPCSRRKVFKTPGSVSYRRMLPYLMDITKEESCGLEIHQRPKHDKGLEETKPHITQASQSEETSKDNAEEGEVLVECLHNGHSDAKQKTVPDCALESYDLGLSCKDQKMANSDCHTQVVIEDLQIVNDSLILPSSDDSKLEDVGMETDGGIPCKVLDEDILNTKLSPTADGSSSGTDNELGQYSEDSRQLGNERMGNFDVVQLSKDQKLEQLNDQRGGDDGEVVNQVSHLKEESIQMTPADADIYVKPEVEGNVANREDCILQSKDHCLGKLTDEINHRTGSLDYNLRPNSKCRGVLKPRSQLKLFRSPGSFSYGRMLPFIMDIAKDNSDAFGNGYCIKPEKDLEQPSNASNEGIHLAKSKGLECKENQKVVSAVPPLTKQPSNASDNQGIILEKSIGLECKENQKVDSAPPPLTVLSAGNDSFNDEPNLILPERGFVLNVNQIISDVLSEIEASPDLQCSPEDTNRQVESSCTSNCESSSRDELEMSNSNQLSVVTECDSPKLAMVVRSAEAGSPCYTPSPHQVLVHPETGLKKGILKRNPRGCRGLCTCLNCASFRLHAERAFEFSKNQMEDSQEVVTELIKELSYLRKVLEESANSADDQIVVQASLAKEACRKAAEAEELARNRISQMNYDLNIHCRITCLERPRVRFANGVEGNVIPKANFPSEQVLKLEEDK
ncbi:uncharacterized protein LOC133819900 [Humulus lupulus]|uniref:uncharacterized protein LOC133819900 n=1 Tax=Humulus lupulus TaxID=3486 RepID=UPI002B40FACE|nr:uncharacterized protein LOC133819900 [Humulus lupulus]